MRDVLDQVDAWIAGETPVALGTVVDVKRSAPRPPGAKMAVSADGGVAGAISGGCVEGEVVRLAEDVLAGRGEQLVHFGIADDEAWEAGLPCGGEISVWIERIGSAEQLGFLRLARDGGRGSLVTVLDGPSRGQRMLVEQDGSVTGTLGPPSLDRAAVEHADELMWAERSETRIEGDSLLFVDATFPLPRLFVLGAVEVAAALCKLARAAGWRPFVIDPRSRFATSERFPDAEDVVAAWPGEAFARLGGIDRATSIAVLTHDPKLDDAALEIALRSSAAYVGAMGSRRAQRARRERLLELGLSETDLDRLSAPIGLDLGAITPEETALSILAEVVANHRGRNGGRLADTTARIHEIGA